MTHYLLIGSGRTAHYLIHYLLKLCEAEKASLTIADFSISHIESVVSGKAKGLCKKELDVKDAVARQSLIAKADVVISLLPASFHPLVAKDCLHFKKHFLTASYVSDEMRAMQKDVENAGLVFLNEMGVDPGLDHMSALHMVNNLREKGAIIRKFKSYTGGLMSPKHKDNPWEYKFTWNPHFIVTAGRDGGVYMRNHNIKRIPYHRLFSEIDELNIPEYGRFDAYYNRNSLKYIQEYKLKNVDTVIRYTLRRDGFCEAWHALVSLGLTDNQYEFTFDKPTTHRDFVRQFVREGKGTLEERTANAIGHEVDSEVMKKLQWLGIFENHQIPMLQGTSANFLEKMIEPQWKIKQGEQDMIYMAHVCYYEMNKRAYKVKSYMAVEGEDTHKTAMAKTVGLPLAIAAKFVGEGAINTAGVHIPVEPEIYKPVLRELEEYGVAFKEEVSKVEFQDLYEE